MLKIIKNDKGELEIALHGHLTSGEFEEIVSEMQQAKNKFGEVRILLDLSSLEGYDKILIDKSRFFDAEHPLIDRTGIVTSYVTTPVLFEYMKTISKKYWRFKTAEMEKARDWTFLKE